MELAVNGLTQMSHRCRIEDRVRGWGMSWLTAAKYEKPTARPRSDRDYAYERLAERTGHHFDHRCDEVVSQLQAEAHRQRQRDPYALPRLTPGHRGSGRW